MPDGTLIFDTKIDTGGFDAGTRDIDGKARQAAKHVGDAAQGAARQTEQSTQTASKGVGDALTRVGDLAKRGLQTAADVAAGVASSMGGLTGAAAQVGMDFETAFAGVRRTVGASEEPLRTLRQGIGELSGAMPTAATEIAGVAESAGQLGLQAGNLLGFTETMSKLGDCTDRSAEEAATSLARLAQGIASAAPAMGRGASELLTGLSEGLLACGPQMIAGGVALVQQLAQGVASAAPAMGRGASELLTGLQNGILACGPQMIAGGVALVQQLAQGVGNARPQLLAQVPAILQPFCAAFDRGSGQLLLAGANITGTLAQGLLLHLPWILANAGQIAQGILTTIRQIDLLSAGKALIQGLGSGIQAAGGAIRGALQGVGEAALQAFRTIHWAELGRAVMRLLAGGVRGAGSLPVSALKAAGTAALQAFRTIHWAELGRTVMRLLAGAVRGAGSLVTSALKHAGTTAMGAFRSIPWAGLGRNIVSGVAAGVSGASGILLGRMRSLASSALSAAKSALGIHSPSRKFRDQVGKNIVRGIIQGLDATENALYQRLKSISLGSVTAAKQYVAKGDFTNAGKKIIAQMKSGMEKAAKATKTSLKGTINKQLSAITEVDLRLKANQSFKPYKKQYTALGKSLITAMQDGISDATKALEKKLDTKLTSLSKTYQEAYNDLVSARTSMREKLAQPASLYDLDTQLEQIGRYQKGLNKLKGNIPDSLMEQILGMDVGEADNFVEYLNGLSKQGRKAYLDKWNSIQKQSKSYSTSFFKKDIERLKKDYTAQMNKAIQGFQKQAKNIGANVAKGIIEGMNSQKKSLTGEAKQVANELLKALKQSLKIKSPSRRMETEIGAYLPPGISRGFLKLLPKAEAVMTEGVQAAVRRMQARVTGLEYAPVGATPTPTYAPELRMIRPDTPVRVQAEIHTQVDLDGKTVGHAVTPWVNANMGKQSRREARGS